MGEWYRIRRQHQLPRATRIKVLPRFPRATKYSILSPNWYQTCLIRLKHWLVHGLAIATHRTGLRSCKRIAALEVCTTPNTHSLIAFKTVSTEEYAAHPKKCVTDCRSRRKKSKRERACSLTTLVVFLRKLWWRSAKHICIGGPKAKQKKSWHFSFKTWNYKTVTLCALLRVVNK